MAASASEPVLLWLEDIENINPALLSKKRTRDDRLPTAKRSALYNRPVPMSTRGRNRESRGRGGGTSTPQRRYSPRRPRGAAPGQTVPPDEDATPRQMPSDIVSNAPSLSPTRSSASGRSRSSSPRKIAMLAEMVHPIQYQHISPYEAPANIPSAAQELTKAVSRYARGRGVLPDHARTAIMPHDVLEEFTDLAFDRTSDRDELGGYPILGIVDDIVRDTSVCAQRYLPEAAWNCESHHPIGKAAWRTSAHRNATWWENVTTADIEPRSLLPRQAQGLPAQSTRIDFALSLAPSARLAESFPYLTLLPGMTSRSWSPTTLASVKQNPLAILVETKKKGGDPQNAEYQVGIWASAMFTRLRQLVNEAGHAVATIDLPPIPLLIAEGSIWGFSVATIGQSSEVTVWRYGAIGDAETRIGVYKIIAVIQYLISWAEKTFRCWFEEHCCPPIPTETI